MCPGIGAGVRCPGSGAREAPCGAQVMYAPPNAGGLAPAAGGGGCGGLGAEPAEARPHLPGAGVYKMNGPDAVPGPEGLE